MRTLSCCSEDSYSSELGKFDDVKQMTWLGLWRGSGRINSKGATYWLNYGPCGMKASSEEIMHSHVFVAWQLCHHNGTRRAKRWRKPKVPHLDMLMFLGVQHLQLEPPTCNLLKLHKRHKTGYKIKHDKYKIVIQRTDSSHSPLAQPYNGQYQYQYPQSTLVPTS